MYKFLRVTLLAGIAVLLIAGLACTTVETVEVPVEKVVEKIVEKEVPVEKIVVQEKVVEVEKQVPVTIEKPIIRYVETAARDVYPDTMTIAVGALPVTLVGNTIPSLQSRLFSRLMYGQLAALNDATGQVEPEHLESMTLVDDTTVEIVLKKGITFHNGETLDANGLKKSFDLLTNADPQKFTWKQSV